MKIIKIPVGYLFTNCYIVIDEKTKNGVVVDPGDDAGKIMRAIEKENIKVISIINTHSHFDHIGENDTIKEKTGADLFRPEKDGEEKSFGGLNFRFLFTPGHTSDGISFLVENHLFAGDTLFAGSVGRTDLGDGDYKRLLSSIKDKLLSLPGETIVHPGHGPDTTIEEEKKNNPFLQNI